MASDTGLQVDHRYRKRDDAPSLHPEPPDLLTAVGPSSYDDDAWDFRDDKGGEWSLKIKVFRVAYDDA